MLNRLVSIIVPCYNQAEYLDEALLSVLNQTYENWECIIVNDGSLDNTEAISKFWIEKDPRFKYIYKENGGLCSSRNLGISYARGEFILPLDADDKVSKDYVLLALKAFKENDLLKVVYCKAEKFGDEDGIWNLPTFSLFELSRNNLIFCSALFRKNDWELVGGYDINMIYGWEDWEFWIAILKDDGNVKCLDEIGFFYRIKNDSMIKQMDNSKRKYSFEYLSIKHADFFVRHFGSFIELEQVIKQSKKQVKNSYEEKLKSEKFIIDLFCNRFFGFSIFGFYKK